MQTNALLLDAYLQQCQDRVNQRLTYWLDRQSQTAPRLLEAMRYATFNGGKRLRPVLTFATVEALGEDPCLALDAAAAVEIVHSYSLVHDDLPAMDDDALRRGKPTCHIAFDEATAILAGDALQCLAFEVLSDSPLAAMTSQHKLSMIRLLAHASGIDGMAGGQALDLAAEGLELSLPDLERIHRHKTGRLIGVSVEMGALVAGATAQQLSCFTRYANAIGLAFQVQDDILDETGDTALLGKQQGADRALNKATYPRLLGLENARQLAISLHEEALDALNGFNKDADWLRQLARYIVARKH